MNHGLPVGVSRQTNRQADRPHAGPGPFSCNSSFPQSTPLQATPPYPLLLMPLSFICRLCRGHLSSSFFFNCVLSLLPSWFPSPRISTPHPAAPHTYTTHKYPPHSCFPSDIDKWRLTEMTTSLLIFNSDTAEDREKREGEGRMKDGTGGRCGVKGWRWGGCSERCWLQSIPKHMPLTAPERMLRCSLLA